MKRRGHRLLLAIALVFAAALSCGGHGGGTSNGACRNLCGNGTCEEVVCMAIGCPCAESAATCPQDCSTTRR